MTLGVTHSGCWGRIAHHCSNSKRHITQTAALCMNSFISYLGLMGKQINTFMNVHAQNMS